MTLHQLNQISPHVYWLTPDDATDRPVLGLIVGTRASLVVDAGNSPAHARVLLEALARRDLPAPNYAMLTHWHWDHVFGTSALPIPTFASDETAHIVSKMAQLDWSDAAIDQRVADGVDIPFSRDNIKAELPDRTHFSIRPPEIAFTHQVSLDLGDLTCQLVHVGGDHAPDSSIVHVLEDRIVFLGDCIYDDVHHGPRRVTTTHLFPLLDRLRAYDAVYYLPGHHPSPLTRSAFQDEASLLTSIGRTVELHGQNREAVLAALPAVLGMALTDDHIEIADTFLAGLRLPAVESVL